MYFHFKHGSNGLAATFYTEISMKDPTYFQCIALLLAPNFHQACPKTTGKGHSYSFNFSLHNKVMKDIW